MPVVTAIVAQKIERLDFGRSVSSARDGVLGRLVAMALIASRISGLTVK